EPLWPQIRRHEMNATGVMRDVSQESLSMTLDVDGLSDCSDDGRRRETRTTKEQLDVLDQTYRQKNILTFEECSSLAKRLNMSERRVRTWFQNKRAKERRKVKEESVMLKVKSLPSADTRMRLAFIIN
ncbi:Homeobox protein PRH, partial [Planoprotostelium fungivorum]